MSDLPRFLDINDCHGRGLRRVGISMFWLAEDANA
jgi:hypothetical protein